MEVVVKHRSFSQSISDHRVYNRRRKVSSDIRMNRVGMKEGQPVGQRNDRAVVFFADIFSDSLAAKSCLFFMATFS